MSAPRKDQTRAGVPRDRSRTHRARQLTLTIAALRAMKRRRHRDALLRKTLALTVAALTLVLIDVAGAAPPRCATSGGSSWCKAQASYYTPESSGGPFACQDQFPGPDVVRYDADHRYVLGVANKTLPCGTRVRLLYKHRRLTVRVIDRGPYIAGREFDLTSATRDRLRFPSTGQLSWRIVPTP